ncbi:MAG: hypothetical protein Q9181_007658 [Wetmoreana brouardii]
MSGIEVASLALTIFPILVAGLSQMMTGIETINRWKRYRLKLREFVFTLESAHVYFFDTLEELLNDIVPSDQELELLIREPLGALWKTPHYKRRLHERLDRSYDSYIRTIQALASNLKTMCEKLGIDSTGAVKWDGYTTIEREMKRFRLALSQGVYKELLAEIRQANMELREFTHQSIVLEPMERKRRSKRPIAELKLIRKHAASLYQVLMTDKAWKCKCKGYHVASLRLEARPQTAEEIKANVPQGHIFCVLITIADEASHVDPMAQWNEIEIIPSLESHSPPQVSQTSLRVESIGIRNATRGVRFAPDAGALRTRCRKDEASAQTSWKCIEDICSALCTSNRGKREIGLLIDDAPDKHEHKLYRTNTVMGSRGLSRSLEDLLRSRRDFGDEGFSRRARLQIATVLASSVLQLDGTLWLKSGWGSGDIFFHEKTHQLWAIGVGKSHPGCHGVPPHGGQQPDRSSSGMGKYSYPYLSWQRCCHTVVPSQEQLRLNNHMIRSDTLLTLGLILIELCFGRTLMELRKPQDMVGDETSIRLKTATRLHRLVYDEMGGSYGDVVRRCLFQPFDVRELNLDIEEVQQKVLEDIVTPLVEDLKSFEREIRAR